MNLREDIFVNITDSADSNSHTNFGIANFSNNKICF